MGNSQSTSLEQEGIKIVKKIGEGSYGDVYKVFWHNKPAAMKRISEKHAFATDLHDELTKVLLREWEIQRSLRHPNIVTPFMLITPIGEPPIILTELLACDLYRFIRASETQPRVSFDETVSIMLDVAEGLAYLHQLDPSIVHRDLATKNILLTSRGSGKRAKIADLGVAKIFPNDIDMHATVQPGTPIYSAPETQDLVRSRYGFASYSAKVDIFSFGVILLETILGGICIHIGPPYMEDHRTRIPEQTRRVRDIQAMGDHRLRDMVLQCLENDPDNRPEAVDLADQLKQIKTGMQKSSSQVSQETHKSSSNASQETHSVKIAFLGNASVGKSSLLSQLRYSGFDEHKPSTVPYDLQFVKVCVLDKVVKAMLVDTAGMERYHANSVVRQVYRNVHGAILVFDVNDKSSFVQISDWLEKVRRENSSDIPLILVGNKIDQESRVVDSESAQKFAEDEKFESYLETSAKTGENVHDMLSALVRMILERNETRTDGSNLTILSSPSIVLLHRKRDRFRRKCCASS